MLPRTAAGKTLNLPYMGQQSGTALSTAMRRAQRTEVATVQQLRKEFSMDRTLKLSLLTMLSCMAAAPAARAEDSSAAYVDDTSVVGLWDDATKTTIGDTAE